MVQLKMILNFYSTSLMVLQLSTTICLASLAGSGHRLSVVDFDVSELEPNSVLIDDITSSGSSSESSCENITMLEMCSSIKYQTRFPNHFKDQNQVDASERALRFRGLVNSRCSPQIHSYICQLLAPVCVKDYQTLVYPCRSFCEQVKNDCRRNLHQVNGIEFDCERLPYERNGEGGPCHDPRVVEATGQQMTPGSQDDSNLYKAYDSNYKKGFPFYTETETIKPQDIINQMRPDVRHIVRQPAPVPGQPDGSIESNPKQQQSSVLIQIQTFGQNVLLLIIKYSNILSIVAVICLLIALNSKKLRRFKNYLRFTSSSSSSTNSSNSSTNHGKGYYPPLQGQPQIQRQVSPSASSKSLMLIAGLNSKQAPCHKLISASGGHSIDPSQKLLHDLNNAKTLINVNNGQATLDGHRRLNGRYYQVMNNGKHHSNKQFYATEPAHSDKQQLFNNNTLDSDSSHSNQYDYIMEANQPQQLTGHAERRQQLYSNILLSSPSHQVLLMDSPHSRHQHQHNPPDQPPPQPPTVRPLFSSNTDDLTPYAASCAANFHRGDHLGGHPYYNASQRSFQRRPSEKSSSAGQRHGSWLPASSASSPAASSTSSAVSPPGSSGNALLGNQQHPGRR